MQLLARVPPTGPPARALLSEVPPASLQVQVHASESRMAELERQLEDEQKETKASRVCCQMLAHLLLCAGRDYGEEECSRKTLARKRIDHVHKPFSLPSTP